MKKWLLFNDIQPHQPLFWFDNKIKTLDNFKQDVCKIAANLPNQKHIINLCNNRYLFAVVFIASILKEKINLLPANRTDSDLQFLKKEYDDTQKVTDEIISNILKSADITEALSFEIDPHQLVAIVFTSGSTGTPRPNQKHWHELAESARRTAKQLGLNKDAQHTFVATVPPQHMFGFETTIIFPLVTGVCVHSDKPFFAEDIRQTLSGVHSPCILITTPLHMRACVKARLNWPDIDFVLSATAPLTAQLAAETEASLKTTVKEIYGCSEAGVIATRKTTREEDWTLLPEYQFVEQFNGYTLKTPLHEDILIPDQIERINDKQFRLLGRQSDLIKIAGKRGSLSDLRIKLCSIEGIDDAVFFMPDESQDKNIRLAAFVVTKSTDLKEISARLGKIIDPAFLPRPILRVAEIPYNDTGKLAQKDLMALFTKLRNKNLFQNSA